MVWQGAWASRKLVLKSGTVSNVEECDNQTREVTSAPPVSRVLILPRGDMVNSIFQHFLASAIPPTPSAG